MLPKDKISYRAVLPYLIYESTYPILCPENECTRVVMAPGTLLAMAK